MKNAEFFFVSVQLVINTGNAKMFWYNVLKELQEKHLGARLCLWKHANNCIVFPFTEVSYALPFVPFLSKFRNCTINLNTLTLQIIIGYYVV